MTEPHTLHPIRDRRGNACYPLRLKLNFLAVTQPICSGDGETLHISSKELLFTAEESFIVGQRLQVSLDWPARLENIPLKLVVAGQVLQSGDGRSAMTIDKYEFRIRGIEPSIETRTLQSRPGLLLEPAAGSLGRDKQSRHY